MWVLVRACVCGVDGGGRKHEEEAAKRSTARRVMNNMPTSTRTKIIVDSHKAQVCQCPDSEAGSSSPRGTTLERILPTKARAFPEQAGSRVRQMRGRCETRDLHCGKTQVYPPLLNPKQDAENNHREEDQSTARRSADRAGKGGVGGSQGGGGGVDDFLKDASITRMINSRPNSARPGSGKGTPAGGGMAAAAALRAS